jgi:hypothetical protein
LGPGFVNFTLIFTNFVAKEVASGLHQINIGMPNNPNQFSELSSSIEYNHCDSELACDFEGQKFGVDDCLLKGKRSNKI